MTVMSPRSSALMVLASIPLANIYRPHSILMTLAPQGPPHDSPMSYYCVPILSRCYHVPLRSSLSVNNCPCLHPLLLSCSSDIMFLCYHVSFNILFLCYHVYLPCMYHSVETWLHPWLTVKPVGCTLAPLYSPCI